MNKNDKYYRYPVKLHRELENLKTIKPIDLSLAHYDEAKGLYIDNALQCIYIKKTEKCYTSIQGNYMMYKLNDCYALFAEHPLKIFDQHNDDNMSYYYSPMFDDGYMFVLKGDNLYVNIDNTMPVVVNNIEKAGNNITINVNNKII